MKTTEQILEVLKPFMLDGKEDVGDNVWSSNNGSVKITRIRNPKEYQYPILTDEPNTEAIPCYTTFGFSGEDNKLPTLFKRCPYGDSFEPREVEVLSLGEWFKRKAIAIQGDGIWCLMDGSYSDACLWPTWRELPTTTELTMEQIAERFNIPVEQLKIKK